MDDPEKWPKKRILIINARDLSDFIRAGQLVKRFEEDARKYEKKLGRYHGIIYTTENYENPAYVWHTKTQVTVHFGEDHGKE